MSVPDVPRTCPVRARCALSRVLTSCLLAGSLGISPASAPAQEFVRPESLGNKSQLVAPPSTVKLNFLMKEWAEVLEAVASDTGSTLVADELPSGCWSRQDWRAYSRSEAVGILNRELEPKGFRLVEKGEFLVLLNVNSLRAEYGRSVLPAREQPAAENVTPAGLPIGRTYEQGTHTIASRKTAAAEQAQTNSAAAAVRQASHETDAGAGILHGPVAKQPTALVRIELTRSAAVETARLIHASFGAKSRLIDAGPEGLPAFTVFRSAPRHPIGRGHAAPASLAAPPADFTVGIDIQNNALVVSAPAERARQIEGLIQTLDSIPAGESEVLRLVATVDHVSRSGKALQLVVNQSRLRPAGRQVAQAEPFAQVEPFEQPVQPQPPREAAPDPDAPAAENGEAAAAQQAAAIPLQLDLQGPVNIRDVPGVGLVVTGNRADVERVVAMIRALEEAGAGATPDIHLLFLRHVNSEALAEMLNSVYEGLQELQPPLPAGQPARSVRVVPVVKPNAILILAPARTMESIIELAETLDEPVEPGAEFEVFRLRHAVAAQIVTAIDSFFEERAPLGTRVRALADVRTNAVIVQARGRDLDEVTRLIQRLDSASSKAVTRMRIFPLRNAVATQLEQVVNTALQSVLRPPQQAGATGQLAAATGVGGEIPEQLREARSAILEFLSIDGATERLVRSGILADIRVTSDPSRNSLIVTAPEESMDMMAALIAYLDQPTPLVADIKVFTLANSDATTTVALLRSLFEAPDGAATTGVQIVGAEGVGSEVIPLRFSVDARTNSIIALGSAEALDIVDAILRRLDGSDIRQRQTTVIKLWNTPAAEIATALNAFITAQRELAQVDPDLVSTIELLEREIIAVAEPISNSLLISATPRYFNEVVSLVTRLDAKPAEVYIQALLVEVELDNTDELGVQWGVQSSVLFDRSTGGVPGFRFNNAPLGNNVTGNTSSVGGQALSDFALDRAGNALGFGGLVLAASSENVDVLIRALSAKRTVHILSRPIIRTLDNLPSLIQVGQQVPVITGANVTGLGIVQPTITQQQIGIILTVRPRINPDGTIVMETSAIKSSLAAEGIPILVTDDDTVVESPIINLTTAQSTISVGNGQTVVLGGMITKTDDALTRKIPWLGDIPFLGQLFRYDSLQTRRTELLVFLTPRVVRHEFDSELIKRVEAERLHFIEREAEDIHGPLYSAPPPEALFGPDSMNGGPGWLEDMVPTTPLPAPGDPLTPYCPVEPPAPQELPSQLPSPALFPPEVPPSTSGTSSPSKTTVRVYSPLPVDR